MTRSSGHGRRIYAVSKNRDLGSQFEGLTVGAEPYEYTVPYEPDIQAAVLDKLRSRVFESKEFNGAEFDPPTPEAALELTGADGTHSILDISRISDHPDYFCGKPLSAEELERYFGTESRPRSWCGNLMTSGRTLSEDRLDT